MNTNAQAWLAQGKFFRFENLDIYYQTFGQGPVVFLLHGYPYSSYDFRLISPELGPSHGASL